MKNKLIDLNNHLFAQLERLSDESITGDKLKEEIHRSKAITGISKEIVENARLALDAQIAIGHSVKEGLLPEMIGNPQS
ncbi:hypothetical protein [Vibrio furnissii]|uniref:hypothetical protein n=1 Tax=Vibrio furnissii TaxID=29494 RepID=UPI001EEBAC28|nr:hypothetical protein [Vibrio furnissii]MCG6268284.1 hypothetical protein [Vibrio furnissii]